MRSRGTTIIALAVLLLGTGVSLAERPVREQGPEWTISGPDREGLQLRQQQIHEWLLQELPGGALSKDPVTIGFTAEDLASLNQDRRESPRRVGVVKTVDRRFDLATLRARGGRGSDPAFAVTEDGGFVWATRLSSPGASGLRVHFTEFSMPRAADVFLYTLDGQVYGPYQRQGRNGDGDFWSDTAFGDEVLLQVRFFERPSRSELAHAGFSIAEVGRLGKSFGPTLESHCNQNVPCIENAECGGGASQALQNAIGQMLWAQGPYLYTCSGGLIADTDSGSQTPYFLTAHHCISRGKDAKNLEVYFNYTVPCGTSNCPDWVYDVNPLPPHTIGSTIRDSSSNGDHTLLELDEPAPSGTAFLGWTTANVANANGTGLARVSYPAFMPQAYSEHTVDTGAGTCSTLPRGEFIYSHDEYGATEGGSSGSPVVNSSDQIVGQLYGGCGTNINDECDADSNSTVDGAFAYYFSSVESYLDPGTSCTPSPEVCDNGSDDDCDGDVDCSDSDCSGDPACSGGGCTLGQPGDSCTSDAQCCSNKCKGPPNNQTCR
ncbi:MAG: trypsin-like peptidase domain-containing protein [Acidobacteriota bacterium]|jgi:V8-like Glu-specific endopeptidase